MLEIGSLVDGKYKILNKVGQGGMSVVYLAMNEKANKQWAVKEVRKDGIKDFEVVKQGLVAETDILKKLNHPHLPSIIDVIDTDDSFIIIMDYIQGNSLNKALDEYGAQPQEYVIDWAKQLCDVLGYLHTRTPAIIYRDMKPANVMLKPDGNVTLIDFGTAREFKEKNLADTTCLGTVGYAAPEQFGGMGQTDARTDIYCLGATLYHLVTGMNPCEPPYEIKPIREINPSLSSGLERIIQKCTQRDPNDRYQSAAELMYAMEHYEEIDDIYRKKQKKKFGLFLTTCILTVVFAITSVFGFFQAQNQKSQDYDNILNGISQVEESKKFEEYKKAIATDPSRVDAYLGTKNAQGLISYLVDDGELSSDDVIKIEAIRNGFDYVGEGGKVTEVKTLADELLSVNPEGYYKICYEIGEAYYYTYKKTEGVNFKRASEWFQYIREDYILADIACDIYESLENITKYNKNGQTSKEYEEYKSLWTKIDNLQKAATSYDDDDMKLLAWTLIKDQVYDKPALYDVIPQEEIVKTLQAVLDDSKNIKNNFLNEKIKELQTGLEEDIRRVQSNKTESNG